MKVQTRTNLLRDRRGATAIEYALLAALIVMAAAASFPSMGGWVSQIVTATADSINSS